MTETTKYRLTAEIESPERLITWEIGEEGPAGDFFNLALDEMGEADISITSFRLDRLDAEGNPVQIPEGETVAELSLDEQAAALADAERGGR